MSYEMIHPKFLFKKATEPYLYNESILSDKKECLHLSVRANIHTYSQNFFGPKMPAAFTH